jgi:NarL family two-component system response regulator YdfI
VTRVLIVAASTVVRAGLESLLGSSPALQVAGKVSTLSSLQDLDAPEADVVLLDSDGVALPVVLHREGGALPVVLLIGERETGETMDVVRHGVRGVLPRAAGGDEIVAAIEAVAAGLIVVHPDVANFFQPQPGAEDRPGMSFEESLTPREVEVLALLAEGAGNKEIARQLRISEHTIKFHVGSILAKLGASSRTEAVTLGVRRGLIML